MKTRIFFTYFFVLGFFSVFGQSCPVEVTPITNGFTVSFALPAYALRDTTLTGVYNISEIFKYVKLDDFGIIDDVGFPQLPQYSFDLHVPSDASGFAVVASGLTTQTVSLNRRVLPAQDDEDKDPQSLLPFTLDQAYYASNGSLYNFTDTLSAPYNVFDEQGVTMTIFPFLYNPQAIHFFL